MSFGCTQTSQFFMEGGENIPCWFVQKVSLRIKRDCYLTSCCLSSKTFCGALSVTDAALTLALFVHSAMFTWVLGFQFPLLYQKINTSGDEVLCSWLLLPPQKSSPWCQEICRHPLLQFSYSLCTSCHLQIWACGSSAFWKCELSSCSVPDSFCVQV